MEQLQFNVEGKFITDLARSWFWSENREYSVCEELLCNCLMSGEITEVEQKAYARDIIEGTEKELEYYKIKVSENKKEVSL